MRAPAGNERGDAAVEMAIVAPLVIFIVLAIVQFEIGRAHV